MALSSQNLWVTFCDSCGFGVHFACHPKLLPLPLGILVCSVITVSSQFELNQRQPMKELFPQSPLFLSSLSFLYFFPLSTSPQSVVLIAPQVRCLSPDVAVVTECPVVVVNLLLTCVQQSCFAAFSRSFVASSMCPRWPSERAAKLRDGFPHPSLFQASPAVLINCCLLTCPSVMS